MKFARKPWPSSEMIHNFRPWAAELVHMVRTKTDRSTDLLHRATCYRQRKCKLGPGRGPCSLHRCESSSSLLFNNSHLDIKEARSSTVVQCYLCLQTQNSVEINRFVSLACGVLALSWCCSVLEVPCFGLPVRMLALEWMLPSASWSLAQVPHCHRPACCLHLALACCVAWTRR